MELDVPKSAKWQKTNQSQAVKKEKEKKEAHLQQV